MTLNGPSKIYHLKPVFQLPENLEQNCSMYKMKNLHQQPASRKSVEKTMDNSADESKESKIISEVLKRQEELIRHLQNVQSKVTDLKQELNNVSSSVKTKSSVQAGVAVAKKDNIKSTANKKISVAKNGPVDLKNSIDKNIVINVSPTRPAYSVLILPHLWSKIFSSLPIIHVHSSVSQVPRAFSKTIESVKVGDHNGPPPLNLRLIWKDVPDTELISSPVKQSPLLGEVSLLRLFNRLLSPTSSTSQSSPEDIEHQIVVDSALDTCHQLLYATQKNNAFALAKKLAEYLGSNEWMLGSSSLSIVDAAAWSAILNNKTISSNQLGPNVAKWSEKISALAGISK